MTLTIAKSDLHNRVFGAFTDTTLDDDQYESYLFSLADDGVFEQLGYKIINKEAQTTHPSLLLLLHEELELVPDSNGLRCSGKKSNNVTKDTASTEPSADPVDSTFAYLAGSSDCKIDCLELWLIKVADSKKLDHQDSKVCQLPLEAAAPSESSGHGSPSQGGHRNDKAPESSILSQADQDN